MQAEPQWRLLLFGATGAIGAAIGQAAAQAGWNVTGVSRRPAAQVAGVGQWLVYEPSAPDGDIRTNGAIYDAVCWAQGSNLSDSIYDVSDEAHLELYRANCLYVVSSLRSLLGAGALSPDGARLCVISSIWQERARQNKLSYSMTKAALGGLVRSASVDLAEEGHLINAILPGVLDTPMTAANVGPEQLDRVRSATPFNRLPTLSAVANLALFFTSAGNTSTTGQCTTVDLGFSNARLL